MRKGSIAIRCFVVLMLIVSLVACASTSRKEGTGEYVDNSVITGKIKSQLAADDFLRSFDISVETYKGTVRLSGEVDSQGAVDRAGQIARGVDGVRSVENNLRVKR
jgi:osmotically-inducible protein OsmY